MRNSLFVILIATVFVATGQTVAYGAGCGCGCKAPAKDSQDQTKSPKTVIEVGNKICPVMANKVPEDKAAKVEYEGKIYNLCCAGCIAEFKKDPKKYVAKVKEILAKSQELDFCSENQCCHD